MNIMVLFFVGLIILSPVFADCPEYVFRLIPFKDLFVPSYLIHFPGLQVDECGEKCIEIDRCKSFSYKPNQDLSDCYLFEKRVWSGKNATYDQGLVTYWMLAETCPSDYRYNETYNVCYKPYMAESETMNWFDAQKRCEEDGGYLFLGNSDEKWQIIYSLFDQTNVTYPAYTRVNIGATDFYNKNQWQWLDGSSMDEFWSPGEPNDLGSIEDCACFTWDRNPEALCIDISCWPKRPSLCEIPIHRPEK